MSQSVQTILEAIAPAVAASPGVAVYIELATGRTSTCYYGEQANYAIALRAAHIGSLALRGGGAGDAGSIASKKEGDLAVSYSSTMKGVNSEADLSQTSYGLQLIDLRDSLNAPIGVTGGNDTGCDAIFPPIIGSC